jgi:polysaccharide biosynthesis/export protein
MIGTPFSFISDLSSVSRRSLRLVLLCTAICSLAAAQAIQNPANPVQQTPQAAQAAGGAPQVRPTYVIGAGDQMLIRARDVEEIDQRTFMVDDDGNLTLPLIGVIKATGRTVQQLEMDIAEKLKALVRNPEVGITMTQFRQDVVLFNGAFVKIGLIPLEGRRTLSEMITKVGGLEPAAGRTIRVTRKMESGTIPLPGAIEDSERRVSTVDISLEGLTNSINPAEDIVLQANDTIVAAKAEKVYVQGAVNKTGVLDLDERESLSAMQVVIMSGGLQSDAMPAKAEILRPVLNTARRAVIPIDLKQVMQAKANDYPLLPNDILYVPSSHSHWKTIGHVLQIAGPISIGLIFWIISRY